MKLTYQIILNDAGEGHAIKCLVCDMTSYHPEDVSQRFCGKCHIFHEDLRLYVRTPQWLVDSEMALTPEYLKALGVPQEFLTGDTSYSTQEAALGILDGKTDDQPTKKSEGSFSMIAWGPALRKSPTGRCPPRWAASGTPRRATA